MSTQDVVSYKQDIVRILTPEEVAKYATDENLYYILKFLRSGPKTVNDLVLEFEKKGISKSDKSVYRYLKDLIDAKFVAKAGKRITSKDESELHTETIYVRTAWVFLTNVFSAKKEVLKPKEVHLFHELIKDLLEQKFQNKILSTEALEKLVFELDTQKSKLIVDIFENASEEVLKKIGELNWDLMENLIEIVGWLALSLDVNIKNKLMNCC